MKDPIDRFLPLFIVLSALGCDHGTGTDMSAEPTPEFQYTSDGNLMRPQNYREWVYLSSGIGMTYTAMPDAENPAFTNVFVPPDSYRSFLRTGTWPDRTIFVVEIRASTSHGSINQGGHYQTNLLGLEAEVKDSTHFSDTWAYFGFTKMDGTMLDNSAAMPIENCFNCHAQNAAVEHSFVQFYPTLLDVAKSKGTLRSDYPK